MRVYCQATLERVGARGNTGDLDCQPFYRFIERTYAWHVIAMFAALYALGGLPVLVWGGALRCAWVYHITWFVNSASHVWGYQSYATGDQRCGPVLVLAFLLRQLSAPALRCMCVPCHRDNFQRQAICETAHLRHSL